MIEGRLSLGAAAVSAASAPSSTSTILLAEGRLALAA